MKTERIYMRVSEEEKAALEAKAKIAGDTVSEYVRKMALTAIHVSKHLKAHEDTDALEKRIKELSKTLPRSTAERIARTEQNG